MQIRIAARRWPLPLLGPLSPNNISLSRAACVNGKGPDSRGLRSEGEEIMSKLITANELAGKPITELSALYRAAHDDLVRTAPGSHERRMALANLENISRAMACAGPP